VRQPEPIDEQIEHAEVQDVGAEIRREITPEAAWHGSCVLKGPGPVEQKRLQGSCDIRQRHRRLVADANCGQSQIDQVQGNVGQQTDDRVTRALHLPASHSVPRTQWKVIDGGRKRKPSCAQRFCMATFRTEMVVATDFAPSW